MRIIYKLIYNVEHKFSHVNHVLTDNKQQTLHSRSYRRAYRRPIRIETFRWPHASHSRRQPTIFRLASDDTFDPITLHVIDDDRVKALWMSSYKTLVPVISSVLTTSHIGLVFRDINPINKTSSAEKRALYCAVCAVVLVGITRCIQARFGGIV